MANSVQTIEYVTTFKDMLDRKYATELKSYALAQSNQGITFLNEKTIKVPKMVVGGFKPHTRGNVFNTVNVSDAYETFTLNFDRDAEFVFRLTALLDSRIYDLCKSFFPNMNQSIYDFSTEYGKFAAVGLMNCWFYKHPEWTARQVAELWLTLMTKGLNGMVENRPGGITI